MSGLTLSSMHDARDAEDQRLLAAGEYALLVESYYGVILDRCRLWIRREDEGGDVAHEVVVRLLSELKRGRRYRVPFRVVVHQVIYWKVKEHFAPAAAREVELTEWLEEASGEGTAPIDDLLAGQSFAAMLAEARLSETEQKVVCLSYEDDLDFGEIARQLGKSPNAVHQIHFRALTKLRGAAA